MDMPARRNELRRNADRLAELSDLLAGLNVAHRDLVAARDLVRGDQAVDAGRIAGADHRPGDRDVVNGVEQDDGGNGGHGDFRMVE